MKIMNEVVILVFMDWSLQVQICNVIIERHFFITFKSLRLLLVHMIK